MKFIGAAIVAVVCIFALLFIVGAFEHHTATTNIPSGVVTVSTPTEQ